MLEHQVGIETKFKNREYPIMVSITELPELKVLKLQNSNVDKKLSELSIGGNVTLSRLQEFLLKICAEDRAAIKSTFREVGRRWSK